MAEIFALQGGNPGLAGAAKSADGGIFKKSESQSAVDAAMLVVRTS
jgi:hypothetical protein